MELQSYRSNLHGLREPTQVEERPSSLPSCFCFCFWCNWLMKKLFPVPRQPVSIVALKVDGSQTNCTSLYTDDTIEMLKLFLAENEGIPRSLQSLYLEDGSDVELADDHCLGSFLPGASNTTHLQQLAVVLVVREAPPHGEL